jgi:hypothetical protein
VLRRFLPDYRRGLERHTLDSWLNGKLDISTAGEIRGQLLTLAQIEELSIDSVRYFYRVGE